MLDVFYEMRKTWIYVASETFLTNFWSSAASITAVVTKFLVFKPDFYANSLHFSFSSKLQSLNRFFFTSLSCPCMRTSNFCKHGIDNWFFFFDFCIEKRIPRRDSQDGVSRWSHRDPLFFGTDVGQKIGRYVSSSILPTRIDNRCCDVGEINQAHVGKLSLEA